MKCLNGSASFRVDVSLPVRGAWVEMRICCIPIATCRRSPCGERGLKCRALKIGNVKSVAPRAGSVG